MSTEIWTPMGVAMQIMGDNFVGFTAAKKCLGLDFDPFYGMPGYLVPFTQEQLIKYRDDYVLIPGLPFTILDIRIMRPDCFSTWKVPAYTRQPLGYETRAHNGWFLIRKGFRIPTIKAGNCAMECVGLSAEEDLPWACELIYSMIVYRSVTSQHLITEGMAAHCKDLGRLGSHTWVVASAEDSAIYVLHRMAVRDCNPNFSGVGTPTIIRPGGRITGGVWW